MNNNENIYDDWRRTLDGLGLQADDRSQQKARVVAARAQVDQAISLATIADSLDQLVAHFTGRQPDAPVEAAPEPEPQGIQSEHDVEIGDLVVPVSINDDAPTPAEVTEVGSDQGEAWVKLDGEQPKFWAKLFTVVEHADLPEPQVIAPEPVVAGGEPSDDLDDDFGDSDFAGKTDADEQQADALAALRARQGKGKKATRK